MTQTTEINSKHVPTNSIGDQHGVNVGDRSICLLITQWVLLNIKAFLNQLFSIKKTLAQSPKAKKPANIGEKLC